jgi:hypothetical protein
MLNLSSPARGDRSVTGANAVSTGKKENTQACHAVNAIDLRMIWHATQR